MKILFYFTKQTNVLLMKVQSRWTWEYKEKSI